MPPIISVVGKSGSGKTTLIEKLVPELKKRGYKIGAIKHASHGFEIDQKGKDSWRHKAAGADAVLVASPGRIALVKDDHCDTLSCLENYFLDMDLIVTEGFKKESKPQIEVYRKTDNDEPFCLNRENLIACVTDAGIDSDIPKFGFDEITALVDFIEKTYLRNKEKI
jgi:molybdopterin-guanine dinucleotide biosynthesis protein B